MLRERLNACRKSEAAARTELNKTTTEAREKVKSALLSRGWMAARVMEAVGGCRRSCSMHDLVSNSRVTEWARRYEARLVDHWD